MADADLVLKTKIEIFKAVIERDPQAPVFVELAESLVADSRPEEAVEICRRGLEYHPGLLAGRVALIEALLASGRTEEAREAFSSARMEASLARRYLGRLGGLADDLSLVREPAAPKAELPLEELVESLSVPAASQEHKQAEGRSGRLTPGLLAELLDEDEQSGDGSGPLSSATLAQLYLDQGYKDSAAEVIKRLLQSDPANPALQKRLEELAAGSQTEFPAGDHGPMAEPVSGMGRMELAGILTRWRDAIRDRLAREQT